MLKKIEFWFHLTKNQGVGCRKRKRPPNSLGLTCALTQEMKLSLYFTPDLRQQRRHSAADYSKNQWSQQPRQLQDEERGEAGSSQRSVSESFHAFLHRKVYFPCLGLETGTARSGYKIFLIFFNSLTFRSGVSFSGNGASSILATKSAPTIQL